MQNYANNYAKLSFGTVDVKVLKCFYIKRLPRAHISLNAERCYSGEQHECNLFSVTFSHTDRQWNGGFQSNVMTFFHNQTLYI